MNFNLNLLRRLAIAVICFLLWWAVTATGTVAPVLLPSPVAVTRALVELLAKGHLLTDLGTTARRVSFALIIGGGLGIPIGLLFGHKPKLYAWFEDLLHALRSVPATCLFPLLLIVIGVGESSIVVLAAYPCLLIFLVNAASGAMLAEKSRIRQAEALGATSFQVIKDVLFYEALPHLTAALRTCVSYALVLIVAVEMFIGVGQYGIGRRVFDLQSNFQIPETYAAILVTGAFGILLNYLVSRLERHLLRWLPQSSTKTV